MEVSPWLPYMLNVFYIFQIRKKTIFFLFLIIIFYFSPWSCRILVHGGHTELPFGEHFLKDEMQIQFVKVLGCMLRYREIFLCMCVFKHSSCFEEQLIQLIVTSCQPP